MTTMLVTNDEGLHREAEPLWLSARQGILLAGSLAQQRQNCPQYPSLGPSQLAYACMHSHVTKGPSLPTRLGTEEAGFREAVRTFAGFWLCHG
jgi:hypothetical protein